MLLKQATLKKVLYFILLQFLFTGIVNAQYPKLSFQRIGVDQGLSQGSVFGIYQDSLGFMWFGTADGLDRYDGYSFVTYRQQDNSASSLKSNCFRNFFPAKDKDVLWVTTTGTQGLYRFNMFTGEFKLVFAGKNKHVFGDVIPFKEEGDSIWFMDEDQGIECMNWKTGEVLFHDPGIDYIRCRTNAVCCSGNKEFFLGKHAACSFDLATHKTDTLFMLDATADLQVLCIDEQHTLWVANLNSIVRFDPVTKKYEEFKESLAAIGQVSINSMVNISNRYLCIGTERNGYILFDKITHAARSYISDKTDATAISPGRLASMYIDRSQNLWTGGDPYGICKADLKKAKFYHEFESPMQEHGLSSNFMKCFLQAGDVLYIGTYDKGLNAWNRKTNTYTYFLQEPVKGNTPMVVYALDKDSKNNVWIATERGVRMLDAATNKIITPRVSDNSLEAINSIKVMNDDSILVGLREGLCLLRKEANGQFYADHLINKNEEEVRGFITDKANRVLMISVRKLMALEKDAGTNKIVLKILFNYNAARIKCFYKDKNRNIWIGTENGLLKLNPDYTLNKIYGQKDGLPNSFIYGIEDDHHGNFWISTNRGLSKFDPAKETFKNYDVSDGLQANEFNTGAHYRNDAGELFFGGLNGFNYFYPDSVVPNKYLPKVVLTDFKLFDKAYALDTAIEWKRRIDLPYTQNSISFEFAALEYTGPEKNQYAYRLVGADNSWVIADKKRYARYADLHPGNYTFLVKATNNDGVWSDKMASISICIKPPFWQTWYFISGIVLFFIAIVFFTIRYFTAKKYKLELREVQIEQSSRLKAIIETEEKERKRIARELHDGLGQMLSTARLTVSGLEESESEEDRLRIQKSLKIIDAVCEEVRHISHNMMPGALIQMGLLPALEDLVETINASGKIQVAFNTNVNTSLGESVEIAIYRIVQEVCNNIIKHAQAKNIEIVIFKNDRIIDVEIKDDGVGFSTALIEKSMGIGWKNIYSRVSSLNGTIKVNSTIGKGTTIKIQIIAQ